MADDEDQEDDMEMDMDGMDDEEEEEEEEDEGQDHHATDLTAIKEVRDKTFEEVQLPEAVVEEVQNTWNMFISQASSREAAAESLYAALYDSAPSLQHLFKTPRAVMSIRILNGISTIVNSMSTPGPLKIAVETFGFQHLELEVTVPRVVIFRDAIVDLVEMEVGGHFTSRAKSGWMSILNYVGGAFIYVRVNFSERLKIIASSWATANNKASDPGGLGEEEEPQEGAEEEGEEGEKEEGEEEKEANRESTKKVKTGDVREGGEQEEDRQGKKNTMKVPTTFNEMFMFNGAVMGFGSSLWMQDVLEAFDDIVSNVSNSYRLQEACDTLSLTLAKYKGTINLAEFKAVTLASLRSLVPKDWGTDHEVAWSWLWENVERMLKDLMGKPQVQERGLERFILGLTEDSVNYLRRELYKRFFALAPAGQDFFKQSTTRLYWIADRVVELTIEMYREPKKMVNILSAIGLRHVGYGVLTEFFAPYVTGAVEVVRSMTTDQAAEEGFKWSLSLIGRILVRTINEGSTIVMKAVNNNSEKTLRRAVAAAPRGRRALWMLNITVGTQSISPLYWAIESGSLNTSNAMIKDLLVIRADRDNYYYGCDDLFDRHPDIIHRLCSDAPALLPTLLNGLIWRSRNTSNGSRRVNYYIKHLMQDLEGGFNQALEWLVHSKDPKIICHPVVTFFSDLIWTRLANWFFLLKRLYFLFTLCVFICSQAVLQNVGEGEKSQGIRTAIFVGRVIIYLGSAGQLLNLQVRRLLADCRERTFVQIGPIKLPAYLTSFQDAGSLSLLVCLLVMMTQEPIFHCFSDMDGGFEGAGLFTQICPRGREHRRAYKTLSMFAMAHYWVLLTDLTIFSMRISAYVLVIGRVLSEVALFLLALAFLIGTFATALTVLDSQSGDLFTGVPRSALSLYEISLGMFDSGRYWLFVDDGVLTTTLCVFIIVMLVFLMQLLVAQLNEAYQTIFEDMVGYARLNRGDVIVSTMAGVSAKRWGKFLAGLKFEEKLEFNEGDIGLAGGIQELEPANANPTAVDTIVRFGGSTSPAMQWPEDPSSMPDDEDDKYEKLEKQLNRISKKLDDVGGAGKSALKSKRGGESSMAFGSSTGSDRSE